jgi:hypothetical protein
MSTEEAISNVQQDHEQRKLECKTLPKKRKGKRRRLRPNTALISYAANAKGLLLGGEPRMGDVVGETVEQLKRGA